MHKVIMTSLEIYLVSPLHRIRPTLLTDEILIVYPPLHLTHRGYAARLVRDAVKLRASRAPRAIVPPTCSEWCCSGTETYLQTRATDLVAAGLPETSPEASRNERS